MQDKNASSTSRRDAATPISPPAKEPLLNEREAAAYLNVSDRTMQAWRVRGGGPLFLVLGGRAIRYRSADLEAWLSSRACANTSQRVG